MFNDIKEAFLWVESRRTKTTIDTFLKVYQYYQFDTMQIPAIHVTGTNGKGSTVDFVRSILETSGYKVGVFVSPYLYVHNDRIRVNNEMISDVDYLKYLNDFKETIDQYQLSMFQIDFLIALAYFKDQAVEAMIIEVGIGGLKDCTNVISPVLSIITTISKDHVEILGPTIEDIATQKAGIIKPHTAVVVGKLGPVSMKVIEQVTSDKQSMLIKTSRPQTTKLNVFTYKNFLDVTLKTEALYQQDNAAIAIEAGIYLKHFFSNIQDYLIQLGIERTQFEGRFEQIRPNVYLDGAHNIDGIQNLIFNCLAMKNEPIEVIYAGLKRPDIDEIIQFIDKHVDHLVLTSFEDDRIYDVNAYKDQYEIDLDYAKYVTTPSTGIRVLTGSLHFVSKIKQLLKES